MSAGRKKELYFLDYDGTLSGADGQRTINSQLYRTVCTSFNEATFRGDILDILRAELQKPHNAPLRITDAAKAALIEQLRKGNDLVVVSNNHKAYIQAMLQIALESAGFTADEIANKIIIYDRKDVAAQGDKGKVVRNHLSKSSESYSKIAIADDELSYVVAMYNALSDRPNVRPYYPVFGNLNFDKILEKNDPSSSEEGVQREAIAYKKREPESRYERIAQLWEMNGVSIPSNQRRNGGIIVDKKMATLEEPSTAFQDLKDYCLSYLSTNLKSSGLVSEAEAYHVTTSDQLLQFLHNNLSKTLFENIQGLAEDWQIIRAFEEIKRSGEKQFLNPIDGNQARFNLINEFATVMVPQISNYFIIRKNLGALIKQELENSFFSELSDLLGLDNFRKLFSSDNGERTAAASFFNDRILHILQGSMPSVKACLTSYAAQAIPLLERIGIDPGLMLALKPMINPPPPNAKVSPLPPSFPSQSSAFIQAPPINVDLAFLDEITRRGGPRLEVIKELFSGEKKPNVNSPYPSGGGIKITVLDFLESQHPQIHKYILSLTSQPALRSSASSASSAFFQPAPVNLNAPQERQMGTPYFNLAGYSSQIILNAQKPHTSSKLPMANADLRKHASLDAMSMALGFSKNESGVTSRYIQHREQSLGKAIALYDLDPSIKASANALSGHEFPANCRAYIIGHCEAGASSIRGTGGEYDVNYYHRFLLDSINKAHPPRTLRVSVIACNAALGTDRDESFALKLFKSLQPDLDKLGIKLELVARDEKVARGGQYEQQHLSMVMLTKGSKPGEIRQLPVLDNDGVLYFADADVAQVDVAHKSVSSNQFKIQK